MSVNKKPAPAPVSTEVAYIAGRQGGGGGVRARVGVWGAVYEIDGEGGEKKREREGQRYTAIGRKEQ